MSRTYCRIGYEQGDYGSGIGITTSAGVASLSYDVKREFLVNRTLDIITGEKHYTTKKVEGSISLSYRPTAVNMLLDSLFGGVGVHTFGPDSMAVPLIIDAFSDEIPIRFTGVIITTLKIEITTSEFIKISANFMAKDAIRGTRDYSIDYTTEKPLTPFNTTVTFFFGSNTRNYEFTTTNITLTYSRNPGESSFSIGSDLINGVRSDGVVTMTGKIEFNGRENNVFNNLLFTYGEVDNVKVFLTSAHDELYAYFEDVAIIAPKSSITGLKTQKSIEFTGYANSGFYR